MSRKQTKLESKVAKAEDFSTKLSALGVEPYIHDALLLLLENRPKDQVAFLASYFKDAAQRETSNAPVQSFAFQLLKSSPIARSQFMMNLRSAFAAVQTNSVGGLTLQEYTPILQSLCPDFPIDVSETVLDILSTRGQDPDVSSSFNAAMVSVDFSTFAEGIHACLCYGEFLKLFQHEFQVMYNNSSNRMVSKTSGEALLPLDKALELVYTARENKKLSVPSPQQINKAVGMLPKKSDEEDGYVTLMEILTSVFKTMPLT